MFPNVLVSCSTLYCSVMKLLRLLYIHAIFSVALQFMVAQASPHSSIFGEFLGFVFVFISIWISFCLFWHRPDTHLSLFIHMYVKIDLLVLMWVGGTNPSSLFCFLLTCTWWIVLLFSLLLSFLILFCIQERAMIQRKSSKQLLHSETLPNNQVRS